MNLMFANPLTLAYHYLLLYMYGTPLEELHTKFQKECREVVEHPGKSKFPGSMPEEFDFIIVGGGTAGSVLANRLSETNFTVLVLEAGGHPFPLTAVPALIPLNLNYADIDWMDQAVPQTRACQALTNKGPIINRGKGLGGSSNLNYLINQRGSPRDYDHWAEETGDPSWSYENLLPYFEKLENYHGKFAREKFHGDAGPIYVSEEEYHPTLKEWLEAGEELGYEIRDPNAEQTESFFPLEFTLKGGTRNSAHRGYMYPALNRPNLNVKIYAHATKIIFDDNNRATGVEYFKNNRKLFAAARKEVIVSSGAIGSPQLLMLSGIGPEDHLRSKGIPVRVNSPVGQNLQDHIYTYVGPFILEEGRGINGERDYNLNSLMEYISTGGGPFSTTGVQGGAFIASKGASPGWPDIYLLSLAMGINNRSVAVFRDKYNIRGDVIETYFAPHMGKDVFFVIPILGLPRTRGEVRLRSNGPFDRVDIDPKYFLDERDISVLMEGIKFSLKIGESEAFRGIGAKLTTTLLPGCERHGNNSKENEAYWECHARELTHSLWHYTSTARMGRGKGDSSAVVDSKLRVIGTQGLRVIDASVIPTVPNGNTQIPVITIAEKGADLIKNSWKDFDQS